MGRLSLHTDKKLLACGMALARKKGLSGFSVRELCAKSKVNLGMFHYYFKTKERFDQEVLRAIYNQMIQDITIEISPRLSARKNTEHILKSVHVFVCKNQVLLSALAADILGGDKHTLQFIVQHFTEHVSLLLQQLRRARLTAQAAAMPIGSLAVTLVLPVALPQLFSGTLERLGRNLLPPAAQKAIASVLAEENTDKRISLLLQAAFEEEV